MRSGRSGASSAMPGISRCSRFSNQDESHMIHLPVLRYGVPYRSLDVVRVPHHRTREPFVEISQANPGLIRRDLRPELQAAAKQALAKIPFERLIAMCAEA